MLILPSSSPNWPLDEVTGSTAHDHAGTRHGPLIGNPIWTQGPDGWGGALEFDGDDHVEIWPLNLYTNTATITALIKRNAPQNAWSGIVFSRDGSTAAGLGFGQNDELRYHWNDLYWWWDSGIIVPDDQWALTALVIEPDRATIYMLYDDVIVQAVNADVHALEEFNGLTRIGHDAYDPDRKFIGTVDDVRVYNWALRADEIEALYHRFEPVISTCCSEFLPADLDRNCLVDMVDFALLAHDWLKDTLP